MTEEITKALIFDTGSGYFKAGFAENDYPTTCIPTIFGSTKEEKLFGHEALNYSEDIVLTRPIQRGIVVDWDKLEHFWHNYFVHELKSDSAIHPIVCGIHPNEKKRSKEILAQVLFESFNVPGLYCSINSLLSLYGSGKTTALIFDSGFDMSSAVPIIDGYCISHAEISSKVGGQDINDRLRELFNNKQNADFDHNTLEELKLSRIYLAQDYLEEIQSFDSGKRHQMDYELPDGSTLKIGKEACQAAEIILQGAEDIGLIDMVTESIAKLEATSRREIYQNIILAGGNTKLQGFVERINNELSNRNSPSNKVKVIGTTDRQFLPWIGGSVVSALGNFQSMWITQADYDENGPSIVHRKCL